MGWNNSSVFQVVIIEGPHSGTFTYDASGNLRSADVGQTTTDPIQGITCQQGISTFNGRGAVVTLNSTLTGSGAFFWYADTGTSVQGALILSNSPFSSNITDPFANLVLPGLTEYTTVGGQVFAISLTGGLMQGFISNAGPGGPYTALGSLAPNPDGTMQLGLINGASLQFFNVSGCMIAARAINTVTTATFGNLTFATIAAGTAVAGAVYELECGGYGNVGTTPQNLTLQARFGASPGAATDVVGVGAVLDTSVFAVSDNIQWSAKIKAICVTSGAAATWRIFVTGTVTDTTVALISNNLTTLSYAVGTGPNDITQDSTAAIVMGLSAKWAAVTGGPTISKSSAEFGRRA